MAEVVGLVKVVELIWVVRAVDLVPGSLGLIPVSPGLVPWVPRFGPLVPKFGTRFHKLVVGELKVTS